MNESKKNNKRAKALWLRSGAVWSVLYGHLTPKSLEGVVLSHLEPQDCSPEMMSLLRAVLPIHDFALQLPDRPKDIFMAFADFAWERPGKGVQRAIAAVTEGILGPEPSPWLLQLVSTAFANIATHATLFPQCGKEAFHAFADEAWQAGHHQYRVRKCEIEGSIVDGYGAAINMACGLALFGERKGLLHPGIATCQ